MKRLDRDAFHWPDTPDELLQVTMKEMHWLCDGLSLNQKDAFEKHEKNGRFQALFLHAPGMFFLEKKRILWYNFYIT